jgi:hypothetical protein
MKSLLRRHPVTASVAVVVLLAAAGVALAPWWIDLGPVRAKFERAASSALAGRVTYERIDLSWFPHAEVVVHSLKVSVPGKVEGAARSVRVMPALLPLLRGKVVLTKIGVEGLDLAFDLSAPATKERPSALPSPGWKEALGSLGAQTLDVVVGPSRMVLSRPGHESLTLQGLRLEAALRSADGKAALTLSRLSAESPRLRVEGSLRADAAVPHVELVARADALDVTVLRKALLSFAGDAPVVAAIFAIVRGGTLTSFSFASSGTTPGDLGVLERMSIHAAVEGARVRIEGPGLSLVDVRADVALEGGVLTAENATARVGRSRAFDGKLLVGLAPGDDRLRVEANVRADLAEVPAILARAIPGRPFREELALVEGLEGSATGSITIGDRRSTLETGVSVSEMRLNATYGRIPWPLRVDGGEFTFDGKRVGVNRLSGGVGRSTFSRVAARVRLGKRPVLESGSGSLVVSLEDFFEGVRTRPEGEALVRNVRRVSGSLGIDVQRLAGPLARLGEAKLDASGTFKEILFDSSSSLPPLSIASGRFAVDDDVVRVEGAETRALDASFRVSGVLGSWRDAPRTIEATAEGTLGPEAIRWGWERASLPAEFRPAAPIALNGVRLSLPGGGALSLAGDFVVANGPRLTLDLAGDGKKMDVRTVAVADEDSHASMALLRQDAAYDVRFDGRLAASTLAKIFAGRPWSGGRIEGAFHALVPADDPGRLTAEGALTATDLDVPTPAGIVTVEHLDARAAKYRLDVTSSSLVLDEQRFSATGSTTFGGEAIILDVDVATGDLAWARVEKVLGRLENAKKKAATPAPADGAGAVGTSSKAPSARLAIGGDVRISVGSFAYGNLVWKPVAGDVHLGKDAFVAAVRKADICGISTTGEARFLPGGAMALEARADSAGPDVNVPLTCLGLENGAMTGSYEASLQVKGEAAASDLPRAVRGPLTFKAVKGRIGKATILTRILGVLNATDVFAGKSGTRVGEAIAYDAITVNGEIGDGSVAIREAALKAPTITMAATGSIGVLDRSLDLMVLSHPLSTVDKAVQAVPVVRHILGRDFLAVAVKVTGSLDDPKARVTPGKDVGKGLVGILERTVTLPVKVFDPASPESH